MNECQVPGCKRSEVDHGMLAHQFQPTEELLRRRQERSPQIVVAADAVLRMTLIRKGLVTLEDLAETEKELKTAGLLGGNLAGNGPSRGGDRKVRDSPQA